jgi:hypothetical protein
VFAALKLWLLLLLPPLLMLLAKCGETFASPAESTKLASR